MGGGGLERVGGIAGKHFRCNGAIIIVDSSAAAITRRERGGLSLSTADEWVAEGKGRGCGLIGFGSSKKERGMEKLVERLEAAVSRMEAFNAKLPSVAGASLDDESQGSADPAIIAYDELIRDSLGSVLTAAQKIGGQVLDVTKILEQSFLVQKDLLIKAKQCKKPDNAGLVEFLKPLNEEIMKTNSLTEGRRSNFFNHLKAIADSLSSLAWIAYSGKDCGLSLPTAHVEESWQTAEFYNNKVLVEYKNKDPDHVEWAKALKDLYVPGLRNYVKSFYPLGLTWSVTGGAFVSALAPAPQKPQPKAPVPPPPLPAPLFTSDASASETKEGMSAVFQEINSGKSVTAGLKKVTSDMKTKNRSDRSGIVSGVEKEAGRPSASAFSKARPPKLELQVGRKWIVENQIGMKNLLIDDCDAKQSVYVFGCKDSVLQVKGKVNNITIDKCTKMGVVFVDVVAAFEIVNCNAVEVQCQGMAPTFAVDNTSGCQLYLSEVSMSTSITTAKSSEINVLIPEEGGDKDWVEYSLPQQFVNSFKDGQFVTTPVSHSGN